jgi:hypothetical protein
MLKRKVCVSYSAFDDSNDGEEIRLAWALKTGVLNYS